MKNFIFFSLGETFLVNGMGWALGPMHPKTFGTSVYSLAHPNASETEYGNSEKQCFLSQPCNVHISCSGILFCHQCHHKLFSSFLVTI